MTACVSPGPPPRTGPVVVYVVDALRPDRMPVYGAARPTTPAAAELAREGVTYTNAFALSTWTRPSTATLLTSLLPSSAGALGRWGRLDESVWSLPEAFQKQGWTTAAFVANGNLFDDRLGFSRGFDVFRPIVHLPEETWHATAREVVEPVLQFIEAQDSPRFFLLIWVVDPHKPYLLEPPYRELFSDQTADPRIPLDYDRSARQADDQFRRIVDALRAKQLWAASTIVFTADHGEEFQEHGARAHGHSLFEEQLRIPMVVKYPNREGGGSRRSDPVSLADLAPTLADLYRLGTSSDWVGESLWRHRLPAGRTLYFTEDLDVHRLYGVRQGHRKLIVRLYPRFSRTLFSLDRDPGEKAGVDLPCGATAAAPPALLEALDSWRERDAAAYPSLRLGTGSDPTPCRVALDLSEIPKPFLTAGQLCDWSGQIEDERLVFAGSTPPRPLYVSADDRGRQAGVEAIPGEEACAVTTIQPRLMQGPMTEEHLEQLRALGYFQEP
jgi:arylsulfatase A-like enzyme